MIDPTRRTDLGDLTDSAGQGRPSEVVTEQIDAKPNGATLRDDYGQTGR